MSEFCGFCLNESQKEENNRPILTFPFLLNKKVGLLSTICLEKDKLQLYVGGCEDQYGELLKEVNVKYCPMCGRKLA